ncbi:hypothetical protein WR25_09340 [Diploscapter pachys]|uniref:Uncharacterized protein n=1 Tax=Diploscapter pachys TaxID=2018661 RepID=A0A2A2L5E6_9BILA|nr:hypothetical protein WR25_09340 [Diploscapter pachys]
MQEELLELLRNPFAIISLSFLMSFCVVAGSQQLGDKVELEFLAYRMHQCELSGNLYGSQNYKIHYEAVSLDSKTLRR